MGLISGLVATVSGLSGSLYVWQPEITAALNPKILKTDHESGETTIHSSAWFLHETYGDSLAYMTLPYREQQTIQVALNNGEFLYFHPQTRELLGKKTFSIVFFEGLLHFHRTLFIPRYGKYVMGGSTVLFFTLLLTSGVYLWWKRHKSKLKKGFFISLKKNSRFLNYDLHKVFGIVFLIPLLIMAFTGSYFTFIPMYKSLFSLVDNPIHASEITGELIRASVDPDSILRVPTGDGYKLRAVYFPQDQQDNYRFRYIRERGIGSGLRKTKELIIDQNHKVKFYSGYDKSIRSEKIAAQVYPIHIGEIIGTWGRFLVFITGFIPALLFITGYRMYRHRKMNIKG